MCASAALRALAGNAPCPAFLKRSHQANMARSESASMQVWEPKNVHAGEIVGASGEIQCSRQ